MTYRAAVAAILVAVAAIGLWNARTYPPTLGYDADPHIEYAQLLVEDGRLPTDATRSEYYTPPGYYAIAGVATELGELIGLGEPRRVAQALNVLFVLGTALLVLALARLLWPGRPVLQLAALAFAGFLPVVLKAAAMFHPETLDLLASAAALYLAARMVVRGDYRLRSAALLGFTLGAGQLVRAFSLWTFAAVGLVLLYVLVRTRERRPVLAATAVVLAVTAALAGPWYVHQALRYSNPVFDPESPERDKPFLERRPVAFYVDPGLPQLFTHAYRPAFLNRAIPTTYTELWGDYFGVFAWEAPERPSRGVRVQLGAQNAIGLVPTALAVVGWVALAALWLRRREPALLLLALVPAIGLAGYLYFTVGWPTADGDVLKATYMLTTAPAWALAFGYALDWAVGTRLRAAVLAALAAAFLVNLRFVVYEDPLFGLL